MPYGDKKSYGFFKMKYQGNNSAFPFKESPIRKEPGPKPTVRGPKELHEEDLQDAMTFKEIFAKSKKEGKKTFNWRGESYSTKTKEEKLRKTNVKKAPTIDPKPLRTWGLN